MAKNVVGRIRQMEMEIEELKRDIVRLSSLEPDYFSRKWRFEARISRLESEVKKLRYELYWYQIDEPFFDDYDLVDIIRSRGFMNGHKMG